MVIRRVKRVDAVTETSILGHAALAMRSQLIGL